jgi:hypothetical protein
MFLIKYSTIIILF